MVSRLVLLLIAVCVFGQTITAIDNDSVRVLVAHQQPHAKTALHEHKFNRVMIYPDSFSETVAYPDKPADKMTFKAGEVQWSVAGGMHTAEITSPSPVTIVEVEIKRPGNPKLSPTGALDPVKVDPRHYKIEFENEQVRVLHVRIGAHESTPLHRHALNRVVVYLTDQDTQHKAGDVVWAGPATHKEENLSDHAFEMVVAELKY